MPRTRFHNDENNAVCQLFWGRVKIEKATALFYYFKHSKYQSLIHQLKYKGKTDVGQELGKMLGGELLRSGFLKDIDVLVPVPLHPKKEKKRGYNQSFYICKGISEVSGIPIDSNTLVRNVYTETQTKRNRNDRYCNVKDAFSNKHSENFSSKHILLIDDVVTTGATLESCSNKILEIANSKVSIASLAVASN
ncbi:MAG: ComF family protein [Bacteroidales bacterium]|nr:ComF family protein [Bacteroidales bacterium]